MILGYKYLTVFMCNDNYDRRYLPAMIPAIDGIFQQRYFQLKVFLSMLVSMDSIC